MFELQFRRWWSSFWKDTFHEGTIEELVEVADYHARTFKAKIVQLGKFPRS
jgi:hypothetical protein